MSKRHSPTHYGSRGIAWCLECNKSWPCDYEQGWVDALLAALTEGVEKP